MEHEYSELPTRISDVLYKANLTTYRSILETQECDLRNLACFSQDDIQLIYNTAAKNAMTTEFISGDDLPRSDITKRWARLTTGCSNVDKLLGGGILTRGVTELAGHSGSGKTQLCLQLAITVQLPVSAGGLAAGAVYITTEARFPSSRLNQLVETHPAAKAFPNIKFANNIFVELLKENVELLNCVKVQLPNLIKHKAIGLIVVDSVAATFRAGYTSSEAAQRAVDLRAFATNLHRLANKHNIAVICVNQVTDVQKGGTSQTVPALGLAWANLCTSRLQMVRNDNVRTLKLVFSPEARPQSCYYKITEAGLEGLC